MTTVEQGLVSYLTGYAGLTALVSTRIYPYMIPQDATLPCVTYQRIGTPRTLTHGDTGATGTLARPRIQFSCWAATLSSAMDIAYQLRAALNGKKGSIGTAPNNVTVRAILVDNELDDRDPETKLFRVIADYLVWQEE